MSQQHGVVLSFALSSEGEGCAIEPPPGLDLPPYLKAPPGLEHLASFSRQGSAFPLKVLQLESISVPAPLLCHPFDPFASQLRAKLENLAFQQTADSDDARETTDGSSVHDSTNPSPSSSDNENENCDSNSASVLRASAPEFVPSYPCRVDSSKDVGVEANRVLAELPDSAPGSTKSTCNLLTTSGTVCGEVAHVDDWVASARVAMSKLSTPVAQCVPARTSCRSSARAANPRPKATKVSWASVVVSGRRAS